MNDMIQSLDFTLEIEGRVENSKLECYINSINSIYSQYLKVEKNDIIGNSIFDIEDDFANIYYEIVSYLFENPKEDNVNIYVKKKKDIFQIIDLEAINKEEDSCWQIMAYVFKREANFIKVFIVIKDIIKYLHKTKEIKSIQDIKNYNDKIMSMSDVISNLSHAWRQPLNSLNFSILNLIDEIYTEKEDDSIIDEYYKEIWQIIKNLSIKIEKFRAFFEMNYNEAIFDVKQYLDLVFEVMEEKIKRENIKIHIKIEKEIKKYGSSNEFVQIMYCILFDIVEYCKNTLDIYNRKLDIQIDTDKNNVFFNIKIIYDNDKYKDFKLCLNHLSMFNSILQKKMKGAIDLVNTKTENKVIISFPLDIQGGTSWKELIY
jgi:hypothetical protein